MTGSVPTHVPERHASTCVQASASSQGTPSVGKPLTHVPVSMLHASPPLHGSPSSQSLSVTQHPTSPIEQGGAAAARVTAARTRNSKRANLSLGTPPVPGLRAKANYTSSSPAG